MRCHWIVFLLSSLLSMALLVVITGQYQMLTILNTKNEKLKMQSEKFSNELTDQQTFKMTMDNLVKQGEKFVMDLEATVSKLSSEMEKKKTESDACQTEKKTQNDELANQEKEHTETEGTLKAESDAWNQEVNALKAQLGANSPICKYVKRNQQSEKLCDFTTSPQETKQ